MIGTLRHLLDSGDIAVTVLTLIFFIYALVLIVWSFKLKGNNKKIKLWNILCFVPIIIALIHFIIFTLGSAFIYILPSYASIYIPAVLTLCLPLLRKKKLITTIIKILIVIIGFICLLLSMFPSKVVNYTRKSLEDSYISLCDYLEENYVLWDWKKADYEK